MGFNKLTADLNGLSVLARTLQAFDNSTHIAELVLVCSDSELAARVSEEAGLTKNLVRVDGGAERYLSVSNGLEKVSGASSVIAVHDGARPLIQVEQIDRCILAAEEFGAAASARPITETVKRADDKLKVTEAVERENLWAMETPQAFQRDLLINAYRQVIAEQRLVTDEVSALETIGVSTTLVPNAAPNPKITFKEDLRLAASLLVKN